MPRATHWVFCKELEATHGTHYPVKAVQMGGIWRLAERGFAHVRYGSPLTDVILYREIKA